MTRFRSTITLSIIGLLLACASQGSVTAKAPLSKPLASFKKAVIVVSAKDASATNMAKNTASLLSALSVKLNQARLFEEVLTVEGQGGDLTMKVLIAELDDGNVLGVPGGAGSADTEVKLSVDLIDAGSQQSIGNFEATGTSKKNVKTSVGGVDTDAMGDRSAVALEAAADQIVEYLKSQRGS